MIELAKPEREKLRLTIHHRHHRRWITWPRRGAFRSWSTH